MEHRNARIVGLVVCLAACAAIFPSAAAAAGVSIRTSQGLVPAFSSAVTDYTTPCLGGTVSVSVTAARGMTAGVGWGIAKSGTQLVAVTMQPGQRITVRTIGPKGPAGYSIRCTPSDFPAFSSRGTLPANIPFVAFSEVSAFVFGVAAPAPYAIVVDRHGVPIWWIKTGLTAPFNVTALSGSRVAYWAGVPFVGGVDNGAFEVHGSDGTLQQSVSAIGGPTDAHEALLTPRGTWFVASYIRRDNVDLKAIGGPPDGSVLDARIQEVSGSGAVLWTWKSQDHVGIAETVLPIVWGEPPPGKGVYDLVHLNSMAEDSHGGLIVSFRDTDSILRIKRTDGQIKRTDGQVDWKLGGTSTAKSLRVLGDKAAGGPIGGQHDARIQPDGTLSVADNRTGLKGLPRVARWKVDAVRRTASLVEQMTDSVVRGSPCCGSARRFSDGSWLVAWGGTAHVRAYDKRHRNTFALTFAPGRFPYRASPFAPRQGTRSQFVAGMDRMNPRP